MSELKHKHLLHSEAKNDDRLLDKTLRPRDFSEFVGQEKIKENLHIGITAAKERQESLDHVLLSGGPGLGKTTLSLIIAREMGCNIRITSGPALERPGDLAAILTNLGDGDILFIDECHRLGRIVEEVLYPAMEEYALDIVIGKGPSARTLRLDLPRFTLIGATTKASLLSSPLRDRFGITYHFKFYEKEDIGKILERSARLLKIKLEPAAVPEIAERSRRTPRLANRLLKRIRDYVQVKADGVITPDLARQALEMLEVDNLGLDRVDREILEIIIGKFKGGPVGLNTIAAATFQEIATIEDIYEPFLLQLGLIDRTPRGRIATEHAYRHLGLDIPSEYQKKLILK